MCLCGECHPPPDTMKLVALLATLALSLCLAEGAVVCYFGSWAVYRQGDGKFDVENIDPAICTHLVFGFAGLNYDNTIRVLDPYNELCENYGKCAFDRFTRLKEKNTNLVTLLAVGGWNEGSEKYSKMAADPAARKTFVDSSIELLKAHNFDGLDLDWEYPTQRGGAPEDKENFVLLLKDLKEGLSANGMALTIAVSAGKLTIDPAYDIPGIAQYVDLVNLMSYDLHGAWDTYTHHQSGLYAHPEDTGDTLYLNQDFGAQYWISGGLPKDKLTLGVPLYGRCWSLDSEDEHGFYAPASQPGRPGPYTNSPGMMGYNEICEKIVEEGWTVVNDPVMNEPYVYHMPYGRIWCSYDDHDSVITKALYARDQGLAGVMVWSIDTGDFHGKCGREFDLIKTLAETFSGDVIPTPPTEPTTTADPNHTTTPTTTPAPPPPDGVCEVPGINADPEDCTHYYLCTQTADGGYDAAEIFCPPGTIFNPLALICDWTYIVCALEDVCPNDCP